MWLWSAGPKTWGLQNGRFAVSNTITENHQNQEESFSYILLHCLGTFWSCATDFSINLIRILCFHNFINHAYISVILCIWRLGSNQRWKDQKCLLLLHRRDFLQPLTRRKCTCFSHGSLSLCMACMTVCGRDM